MRTLAKLAIAPLMAAGYLSAPALAADQNTYRAGSPYLKTVAHSFQQCEQQCKGDAACRGWNFVRPNAGSMSGVCEFNARNAAPTSSPISMSGIISTSVDPLMSRAVSAGAHTIRVGAPAAPKTGAILSRRGKKIVKRMPVPQKRPAMRPTAHTRPVPMPVRPPAARAQDPRKPRIYGSIAPVQNTPKTQPAPKAVPQQKLTREQAYYRDQYLARKRQQDMMMQRQQAALMPRPQAQNRPMPPAPMPMQPRRPQQPQQVQGLYGNLHDDLTQNMTEVPRPRTAPDNLANPNAPMATSRAMPTKPVQTKQLGRPAAPALAGG